jgi:type III restriction enzyme
MTNPMKFKFKVQPCQTNAVDSVVDCFAGQQPTLKNSYTVKINVDQIFKQLSPGTEVKSI